MAVSHISEYLEREGLNEPLQSAYRPFHSTETALVRVQSDLLMALDSVGGAAVILLDQSAAFDLIDHDIFSETLTSEFGLVGTAHKWIMSYLHNRFQQVKVHGVCSSKRPLRYGTPQGSVIGPLLFSLYTKPLGRLLRSLEINFHFYADDCQLYITFDPKADDGLMLARKKMEETVSTVHNWMTTHYLKMNPDKTEYMILTRSSAVQSTLVKDITLGNVVVNCSTHIKNLGVVMDSVLNMTKHINNLAVSISPFHNPKHLQDQAVAHTVRSREVGSCFRDYKIGLLQLVAFRFTQVPNQATSTGPKPCC